MNKKRAKGDTRKIEPATLQTVRRLALALPGAEEGTSYGTPAFKVKRKLFARLHQDGESLVVKIDPDERDMRMKVDPESFYITDHYVGYPMMLVRLSTVDPDDLRDILRDSWRRCAPEWLLSEHDGDRASGSS
jgi:hypothetical protein